MHTNPDKINFFIVRFKIVGMSSFVVKQGNSFNMLNFVKLLLNIWLCQIKCVTLHC